MTLNKNKHGIKIVREDYKKRSAVKVRNGNYTLRTYRFNNIPEYKNKYLSWHNLDFCNGWRNDGDQAAVQAVLNGTKPACSVSINTKTDNIKDLEEEIKQYGLPKNYGFMLKNHWTLYDGTENWVLLLVPEDVKLADYYNLDELREAYKMQDIIFNDDEWYRIESYANCELIELPFQFDVINPQTDEQLVITGLFYGYPIESTASILFGYQNGERKDLKQ